MIKVEGRMYTEAPEGFLELAKDALGRADNNLENLSAGDLGYLYDKVVSVEKTARELKGRIVYLKGKRPRVKT